MAINKDVNKLISKVIKYNEQESNVKFLSMYLPHDVSDPEKISSRVNSLIHKVVVDAQSEISQLIRSKLQKQILLLIGEIKVQAGLAVFFDLDVSNPKDPLSDGYYINLSSQPFAEVTLAKTYNLAQLLNAANHRTTSGVLHLQRELATLFILENDRIHKQAEYINPWIYAESKKAQQVYSPKAGTSIHYYSPGKSIERSAGEHDKKFLLNVIAQLSDNLLIKKELEHLVIVASKNFAIHQEKIHSLLNPLIPMKLFFLNTNKQSKLRELVVSEGVQAERDNHDSFSNFSTGWFEVSKALRQGRVSKILLPKTKDKTGYVLVEQEKVYVYPYAIRNSFKTDHLKSWAVLNANQQNATVQFWSKDKVGAYFRY